MAQNETAAGVATAAALVRSQLPGAHLFVMHILPRSNSTVPRKLPIPPSPERAEAIDALNALVQAKLAGAPDTTLVDCTERFLARFRPRVDSLSALSFVSSREDCGPCGKNLSSREWVVFRRTMWATSASM